MVELSFGPEDSQFWHSLSLPSSSFTSHREIMEAFCSPNPAEWPDAGTPVEVHVNASRLPFVQPVPQSHSRDGPDHDSGDPLRGDRDPAHHHPAPPARGPAGDAPAGTSLCGNSYRTMVLSKWKKKALSPT